MTARLGTVEPMESTGAWPLAVRVAGVAAVLSSAVGYGLHRFMGVGLLPLLVLAAVVGLATGWRLPAAAPSFLQPLDSFDDELEALLDDLL